jgi:hypothetical protein
LEIFAAKGAPPVSSTPAANLLPVSFTSLANLPCTDIKDTSGTTGVVDTSGKFGPRIVDAGADLDLRISPRICEQLRSDPNLILKDLGEDISGKRT